MYLRIFKQINPACDKKHFFTCGCAARGFSIKQSTNQRFYLTQKEPVMKTICLAWHTENKTSLTNSYVCLFRAKSNQFTKRVKVVNKCSCHRQDQDPVKQLSNEDDQDKNQFGCAEQEKHLPEMESVFSKVVEKVKRLDRTEMASLWNLLVRDPMRRNYKETVNANHLPGFLKLVSISVSIYVPVKERYTNQFVDFFLVKHLPTLATCYKQTSWDTFHHAQSRALANPFLESSSPWDQPLHETDRDFRLEASSQSVGMLVDRGLTSSEIKNKTCNSNDFCSSTLEENGVRQELDEILCTTPTRQKNNHIASQSTLLHTNSSSIVPTLKTGPRSSPPRIACYNANDRFSNFPVNRIDVFPDCVLVRFQPVLSTLTQGKQRIDKRPIRDQLHTLLNTKFKSLASHLPSKSDENLQPFSKNKVQKEFDNLDELPAKTEGTTHWSIRNSTNQVALPWDELSAWGKVIGTNAWDASIACKGQKPLNTTSTSAPLSRYFRPQAQKTKSSLLKKKQKTKSSLLKKKQKAKSKTVFNGFSNSNPNLKWAKWNDLDQWDEWDKSTDYERSTLSRFGNRPLWPVFSSLKQRFYKPNFEYQNQVRKLYYEEGVPPFNPLARSRKKPKPSVDENIDNTVSPLVAKQDKDNYDDKGKDNNKDKDKGEDNNKDKAKDKGEDNNKDKDKDKDKGEDNNKDKDKDDALRDPSLLENLWDGYQKCNQLDRTWDPTDESSLVPRACRRYLRYLVLGTGTNTQVTTVANLPSEIAKGKIKVIDQDSNSVTGGINCSVTYLLAGRKTPDVFKGKEFIIPGRTMSGYEFPDMSFKELFEIKVKNLYQALVFNLKKPTPIPNRIQLPPSFLTSSKYGNSSIKSRWFRPHTRQKDLKNSLVTTFVNHGAAAQANVFTRNPYLQEQPNRSTLCLTGNFTSQGIERKAVQAEHVANKSFVHGKIGKKAKRLHFKKKPLILSYDDPITSQAEIFPGFGFLRDPKRNDLTLSNPEKGARFRREAFYKNPLKDTKHTFIGKQLGYKNQSRLFSRPKNNSTPLPYGQNISCFESEGLKNNLLRGPTSTSAPLSSEAQAANIQASCLRRHQAKRSPLIKRFTGLGGNPKGFKIRAYLPKKQMEEQRKEQTEEERKREEKRKERQKLHLPFLEWDNEKQHIKRKWLRAKVVKFEYLGRYRPNSKANTRLADRRVLTQLKPLPVVSSDSIDVMPFLQKSEWNQFSLNTLKPQVLKLIKNFPNNGLNFSNRLIRLRVEKPNGKPLFTPLTRLDYRPLITTRNLFGLFSWDNMDSSFVSSGCGSNKKDNQKPHLVRKSQNRFTRYLIPRYAAKRSTRFGTSISPIIEYHYPTRNQTLLNGCSGRLVNLSGTYKRKRLASYYQPPLTTTTPLGVGTNLSRHNHKTNPHQLTNGSAKQSYYVAKQNPVKRSNYEPLNVNSFLVIGQIVYAWVLTETLFHFGLTYGKEFLEFVIDLLIMFGLFKQSSKTVFGLTEITQTFRVVPAGTINTRFTDLAGIDNMRSELCEIVLFLRNSVRPFKTRIALPNGLLFVGSPGTGKSFVVKAIAGEADVDTVVQDGTILVNQGSYERSADRLAGLFLTARAKAPCILFIDEIDSLGPSRRKVKTSGIRASLTQTLAPQATASHAVSTRPLKQSKRELIRRLTSIRISRFVGVGLESIQSNRVVKPNSNQQKLANSGRLFSQTSQGKQPVRIGGSLFEKSVKPKKVVVKGPLANRFKSFDTHTPFTTRGSGFAEGRYGEPTTKFDPKRNPTNKIDANQGLELPHKQMSLLVELLTQLDGINTRNKVLVIGATNRPNTLDPAVTRPGRLDRVINVQPPLERKRVAILRFYGEKLGVKGDVSWDYLSKRTVGFSSADLATAMNKSTMQSIGKNTVHTMQSIEEGIDSVTDHCAKKVKITNKTKLRSLAYYQAGKGTLYPLLSLKFQTHKIWFTDSRGQTRYSQEPTFDRAGQKLLCATSTKTRDSSPGFSNLPLSLHNLPAGVGAVLLETLTLTYQEKEFDSTFSSELMKNFGLTNKPKNNLSPSNCLCLDECLQPNHDHVAVSQKRQEATFQTFTRKVKGCTLMGTRIPKSQSLASSNQRSCFAREPVIQGTLYSYHVGQHVAGKEELLATGVCLQLKEKQDPDFIPIVLNLYPKSKNTRNKGLMKSPRIHQRIELESYLIGLYGGKVAGLLALPRRVPHDSHFRLQNNLPTELNNHPATSTDKPNLKETGIFKFQVKPLQSGWLGNKDGGTGWRSSEPLLPSEEATLESGTPFSASLLGLGVGTKHRVAKQNLGQETDSRQKLWDYWLINKNLLQSSFGQTDLCIATSLAFSMTDQWFLYSNRGSNMPDSFPRKNQQEGPGISLDRSGSTTVCEARQASHKKQKGERVSLESGAQRDTKSPVVVERKTKPLVKFLHKSKVRVPLERSMSKVSDNQNKLSRDRPSLFAFLKQFAYSNSTQIRYRRPKTSNMLSQATTYIAWWQRQISTVSLGNRMALGFPSRKRSLAKESQERWSTLYKLTKAQWLPPDDFYNSNETLSNLLFYSATRTQISGSKKVIRGVGAKTHHLDGYAAPEDKDIYKETKEKPSSKQSIDQSSYQSSTLCGPKTQVLEQSTVKERSPRKVKHIGSNYLNWNELHRLDRDYVSHGLIFNCFNKAFSGLENNREALDYFADYLLRFEVLRQEDLFHVLGLFGYNLSRVDLSRLLNQHEK